MRVPALHFPGSLLRSLLQPAPPNVDGIAYVVVLATFVSYICLSFAQQRLKPTAVSMYNYCQPVIASSVAVLWGMDQFGWLKTLSVLLVFTGVFLVTRGKAPAAMQEQ